MLAERLGASLHPQAFAEFAGAQFGVFGPIFLGTLIVIVATARRVAADRRALLLMCFALPTLAIMLVESILSRAQPNWSAPTYLTATILVVAYLTQKGRDGLVQWSVVLHVALCVLVLGARDISALVRHPMPGKLDPLHRVRGWHTLGTSLTSLGRFQTKLLITPGVAAVQGVDILAALVCLLLMFYTAESLERESATGLAAISYSTPARTFSLLFGKALAIRRKQLGEEHQRTGKWIVYTSADSVFQIAAHEETIPLEELYEACRVARKILTGKHAVGRVIARPFDGAAGSWRRRPGRRDFSLPPPSRSYLEELQGHGVPVHGVGKIRDLFAGVGIDVKHPGATNDEAIASTTDLLRSLSEGLIFVNLVDTDQVYGHRHDVAGSDPQARPAAGPALGPGAKLRVGIGRAPVVDQRRQLRPHVRAPLDDVDPALHPASTFRPHRIVAENDIGGTDHARSSLRGQPGAPRHDPGARLCRPGDLRGRTRPALRPVLDVPGA